MPAQEILAAMANRYARCNSYRDDGRVVTRYFQQRRPYSTIKPFKTAFVRPEQFRFEFRSRHGDARKTGIVTSSGPAGARSLPGGTSGRESSGRSP